VTDPVPRRPRTPLLLGIAGAFVVLIVAAAVLVTLVVRRGPAGDLRRYLLAQPSLAAHEDTSGSKLNLNAASRRSVRPETDEARLLAACGFIRGAATSWSLPDDTEVSIVLFQFSSTKNAIAYFADETTYVTQYSPQADVQMLSDPPAAVSIVTHEPDVQDYLYTTGYAERGDLAIMVATARYGLAPDPSLSMDLLRQQYGKI
jgi:hypothetical protein